MVAPGCLIHPAECAWSILGFVTPPTLEFAPAGRIYVGKENQRAVVLAAYSTNLAQAE
jgi:hypothetical protein